jgi:spermidine synthase
LQLATPAALYSDGLFYPPARLFLNKIKEVLPGVRNTLVLGCGLGSIIHQLAGRSLYPEVTLLDIDSTVLKWAEEFAPAKARLHTVCANALEYMLVQDQQFDLIFIDVFIGRDVPPFVTTMSFLQQCKAALAPGGSLGLNYIVNDEEGWLESRANIEEVFSGIELISFELNRLFIYKAK